MFLIILKVCDTKGGSSLPSLSRYANELRYALVRAVFVTQVEVHTFHMPHTLRVPREIKLADYAEAPFDMQLRERLEKSAVELTTGIRNGKRRKDQQAIVTLHFIPYLLH